MSEAAQNGRTRVPLTLKISMAILSVAALALGPQTAWAQHGGGGGGGSHGGGGGHSSGGSHGGAKGGAARGTATAYGARGTVSTGSRVWAGGGAAESRAEQGKWFYGVSRWQEPPNSRWGHIGGAETPMAVGATREGVAWGSRGFTFQPRPIRFPRGPGGRGIGFFGGGCFDGFFPGLCGAGFWWGPGLAWGTGCDPDWGCEGYGYFNGDNYDVSGGYDSQGIDSARPEEFGPFVYRGLPGDDADRDAGSAGSAERRALLRPTVTIYLKDGSSYGVTDYWMADGNLHYVTTYGGENSISVEQLDLQKTVDENAGRGVNFTLYNEPARK